MATTVVACALQHDKAVVAHVGDSRCYLIRRRQATLLTHDHTFVGEQVRLGLLTKREAELSANRNFLCRSLGSELFVNVDVEHHHALPGDVLVLCSDGLHNSVSEEDIVDVLDNSQDLPAAARELGSLANERDGRDNITLQLIRARNVERVGMYRGRPYKIYQSRLTG